MADRYAYREHPAAPVQAPRRVVYWSERYHGWWTGLSRVCGHCGGVMDADPPNAVSIGPGRVYCFTGCGRESAEVRGTRPRPLSTEERQSFQHAKRGRPPLERPQRRGGPTPTRPCPDCGAAPVQAHRQRCNACDDRRRWEYSSERRLLSRLESGAALDCETLRCALGLSGDALRSTVRRVRAKGYQITYAHYTYRLETAS